MLLALVVAGDDSARGRVAFHSDREQRGFGQVSAHEPDFVDATDQLTGHFEIAKVAFERYREELVAEVPELILVLNWEQSAVQ